MEIRQFEYFAAIVREGGISRAARRLHISQPALSKQIQALEHELGVELLIRVPEGVRPTDAGRRLSEMSDYLLRYIDEIGPSVREAVTDLRGVVNVGISPSLMPELAQILTVGFARIHPALELHLTEGLPMFLCEWLDMGRLDVGIFTRWAPDVDMPRLEFDDLALDELLFVGAPGSFEPGLKFIDSANLRSIPLALTPGFRNLVRMVVEGDTEQTLGIEIDSLHMMRTLVLRGEYCSALPYTYVRDDLEKGALHGVSFRPAVHRELVAATRAGRRKTGAVDAVIESVRARLTELADR